MNNIVKAITEALVDTQDEHQLDAEESEKLATIMATVARSSKDIRLVFYGGVQMVAARIQEILKEQEKEILAKLKMNDKDEDDVLN